MRLGVRSLIGSLVFVVMLSFNAATFAQQDSMGTVPQATLDCVKVLLSQERAWNAGDMNGFLSVYKNSPDTMYIGRTITRGFDSLGESYRKSYPTQAVMGKLAYSDFDVKPLGDFYALVVGKFQLERKKQDGGNVQGIFTLVMERTEDGWRIVSDHTSVI